jgi:hypothetical protein
MITTRPTADPPADLTALVAHVAAIYRVEEHAKPVSRADEVPASYDAITPDDLGSRLEPGRHPGAAAFAILRITGTRQPKAAVSYLV